jgi:hypothetical protein
MYGKKFWGVARVTYLIDEHGMIARRWGRVIVDGHTQEVLEALQGSATVIEAKPARATNLKRAASGKQSSSPTNGKAPAKARAKHKAPPAAKSAKKSAKKTTRRAAR